MLSGPAMAADNQGTGNVADVPGSLNSSNIFSLIPTSMSLNKMAFLTNGTQLTSGDTLPRGTEVQFVIYIDNTTAVGMSDVSIQDVLDSAFAYQASSMLFDNSAPTGATQAQIYTAVSGGAAVTDDPLDGDVGSAVGVTIDVGNSVVGTNGQADIGPSSVWAILFRALMQ
jgi:uncharacterized repeat protein (TIGR01451 family)